MRDWKRVRIRDVADVFDGPHATPKTVDSGPIFLGIGALQNGRINLTETRHVTPEDFKTWTRRVKPQANDVVFSYETRIGEAAILPKGFECCLGRRMGLVRSHSKVMHPKFFLYTYISPAFQSFLKSRIITGATVERIALKEFPDFPIALPSFHEQLATASVLSALDDKIELNRRMNETLEQMAQAFFKDWFVDFGPVRRKQDGVRDPITIMGGVVHDAARAAELAALFPDAFGEDGLPEGWRQSTLDSIASLNDESWKTSNHPEVVEYVDLSNTKWGVIESTETFSWKDAPSRARRVAKPLDTIIGTVRPGNGSYAFISQEGYTVSTGFAVLRPLKPAYADVLYIAASRHENICRLANWADGHGGAYPAVNPSVVLATEFPFPGERLLVNFGAVARPLREKIEQAKRENVTLAETRDYLLPKLMSGEVRVLEAEKIAEDAL